MRSDPVLELARRGAVRLAAGGGIALSIASAVQVVSGDQGGWITLIASIPTAALAIVMLRQQRPNVIALLSLITAFALAAETYAAVDGQTRYVAGIGAEVVVFGLGILAVFIARDRPRLVAAGFLSASLAIVLVAQLHLNGPTLEMATDIVVMLAVLGTLMYLVIRVLESLSASQTRYSDLAKVLPVAVLELDVSAVIARLDTLVSSSSGVPTTAEEHAEQFAQLVKLVRLSYSNETADELVSGLGKWKDIAAGANADAVRAEAVRVVLSVWSGINAGAGEVSLVRNDGTAQDFLYRWALGQVDGRSAPGILVLAVTDVTQLRQTERELARQLQERDQFVASVSHELRTPLTSILGLTEELVDRPGDFGAMERRELLGIVAAEARDVVGIVEDLLVTARAEAGQLKVVLEPCDLGSEAQRVAELLSGATVTAESVWTKADPVRLRQVLRNLISNAHRHGGPNVRITVTAEAEAALFEIRDDGEPLSAEEQKRIFLPYERGGAGGVVGSVGLGLHVARLLARLMDGDLTYRHDGDDTVFQLRLPLVETALTVSAYTNS
jgi:signal transduction histidine kinase